MRHRHVRLFRPGWLWLLVQAITAQPLPLPRQLVPEPWPEVPEQWSTFVMRQDALSHIVIEKPTHERDDGGAIGLGWGVGTIHNPPRSQELAGHGQAFWPSPSQSWQKRFDFLREQ
jgi:hypothetical protein